MPTSTDLVTDLPADFEVFGQAVDTDFADLLGGASGYILSKASATDLDFAWIPNDQGDITAVNVTSPITGGGSSGAVTIGINSATTSAAGAVQLSDSTSTTSSVLASTPTATKSAYDLAAAAIPKSTVTTSGDVIYATGSSAVTRLGIGSTGNVLTVAGGVPTWAAPAGGGALTKINTTSFSAVSAQSVNSVFTSTYQNYRVLITLSAVTADATFNLRMRASGTDSSGNIYFYGFAGINASGGAANQSASGTAQFLLSELDDTSNASRYAYAIDFYNPQASVDTSIGKVYNGILSAASVYGGAGGGLHNSAAAYDGFTIFCTAGTITGKVTTYGYSD